MGSSVVPVAELNTPDAGNDERADCAAINADGLREQLFAAIDNAIMHMNGDRDELAFQDWDHDDVARAAADAAMAVVEGEAITPHEARSAPAGGGEPGD